MPYSDGLERPNMLQEQCGGCTKQYKENLLNICSCKHPLPVIYTLIMKNLCGHSPHTSGPSLYLVQRPVIPNVMGGFLQLVLKNLKEPTQIVDRGRFDYLADLRVIGEPSRGQQFVLTWRPGAA